MRGSYRMNETAVVAILVGIAGLSFVLAGRTRRPAARRQGSSLPPTGSSSSPSAIANGCTSALR